MIKIDVLHITVRWMVCLYFQTCLFDLGDTNWQQAKAWILLLVSVVMVNAFAKEALWPLVHEKRKC